MPEPSANNMRKSFRDKKRHISVAMEYFYDSNVKYITGADIEDYLFDIKGISEKTRANYASALSDFFKWVYRAHSHFPGF